MRAKHSVSAAMAAGLAALSTTATAVDIDAGAWKLSLGGNINAFYVMTSCSAGDLGAGGGTLAGLACGAATQDTDSVQNGLLPASLNFKAATNQDGWDISANVNVYYGIDSQDGGGADALAFSTVDARQVFLTFGKPDTGTFKLGRDFGLFAFDPIINDMTLLGVGAGFAATNPGHTTLGGLGFGYVYTDRLTQMNYTTPDLGGFTATVGIFQPFDGVNATSSDSIGFHGKVNYAWEGGAVSASFLTQDVATTAGPSSQIEGMDLFAKVSFGKLGLAGYLFDAEGMTSLAIGGLVFPGFSAVDGTPEEVSGSMLQATYQVTPKTRVGINLAQSEQKKVTLVENEKTTLGVYYNLTSSLTLVGEYSTQESKLAGVGTDETSNINLGAILFF